MLPVLLFGAFVLVLVGNFAWRYYRSGSLVGSLLNGRVQREIGQIAVPGKFFTSQTLKVLAVESYEGEPFVGLALQFKGPGAARLDAVKLSASEAQYLIQLLQQARGERAEPSRPLNPSWL